MEDIFYSDIDLIRKKMNDFGFRREPFLFGLNFEMTEGFFVEEPLSNDKILFEIGGKGNKPVAKIGERDSTLKIEPIPYRAYKEKFDIVYEGLKRGDSFLSNLTIKTPIQTPLSLQDIFSLSVAPYQLYVPQKFVCFSPERFVRIGKGLISTNPMKGTINANVANAESVILNDFKETAEHNTIVDLLRNDLSLVSDKVWVERFRYVDRIETNKNTILQVSSEIKGELKDDFYSSLGDIVFKLLPAGSISGAPKAATVALIRSAEKEDRGYYTGVFGYFDGNVLDSAVFIRFIEMDECENMYFRSGGGITAYSNCEDEYNEMLDKIYFPFV